ncbi:protein kinase domain-containing protein [Haloechinothrix sp. LS1_15]|uniref:serine/threonine-protein kinase n=1 Tax=Haloechinothrix sp. LS1_15 TaxID=2652248 RepID=UPI00294AEA82|nr:protein kinase [Haloechinothrix sp. LS1_15]
MDIGTLIGGRYLLEQRIGRGQCGFVWLAHDTRLHRTVAAKPVQPRGDGAQAADGPSGTARRDEVLRQAELARELRHPCAVTVYGVVADDEHLWLITEYVPACTMSDVLTTSGKLGHEHASTVGTRLAGALRAAHQLGLLHRAVEPATVLLDEDGEVRLTDFAVGVAYYDSPYRAPEVLRGGQATTASDVYSLGATLHRAVAGTPRPGHDDETPATTGHQAHGCMPGPFREVVLRMLAEDPATRPGMAGVERALSALVRGERAPRSALVPPEAGPESFPAPRALTRRVTRVSALPEQAPAPARRGRAPTRVAFTVLAACSITLGAFLILEFVIR